MYFKFESDFAEPNIKCIPMIVRFKLDACGIKLTLTEWSRMSVDERVHCAEASCATAKAVHRYGEDLRKLILERTGIPVARIPIEEFPLWSNPDLVAESVLDRLALEGVSLAVHEWKLLSDLQRFALVKLSRSSHESKNFMKAMAEFSLLTSSLQS
jgi:hypothetical protein